MQKSPEYDFRASDDLLTAREERLGLWKSISEFIGFYGK